MIQRSIDRKRSTQGSLVTSMVVHAGLIVALLFVVQEGASDLVSTPDDELTQIAYIEAKYGEDVAAKVKLRTEPAQKGRGVATQSARKPDSKSDAPVHDKEPTGLEEVAAPIAETRAPAPAPKAPPRLSSRERKAMATAVIPDNLKSRGGSLDTGSSAPKLEGRAAAPTFNTKPSGLSSRSRDVDIAGTGAPLAGTRRKGGGVEEVGGGAPALQSRGSGSNGGGYSAPSAGLSSRGRSGGIAEGSGSIAPSGGGSESGRRTVLDYGSGGGGLSSRGRKGGLSEAPQAKMNKPKSSRAKLEETQPANLGGGMTITGQIQGRKILHSVAPKYTDRARKKGWEGVVAVHFTVLANGRVKDNMYFEQTSAHSDLNQAAMAAIKQFKFAPLPADQAAVEQWGVITITFRLN